MWRREPEADRRPESGDSRRSDGLARESLHNDHTETAVARRLATGPDRRYLRDVIFGAIDGIVTTFAVAAGAVGANLGADVVVILGVANLFADGFSMAASNFLGYRAETQQRDRIRRQEEEHVRLAPEGEREEIRQIFAAKGFRGEDLDRAVEVVTSRAEGWVETMMREEHGFSGRPPDALRGGLTTFVAFVVAGAVPLVPFVADTVPGISVSSAFMWSSLFAAVAFVGVGALKSRFVDQPWWRSGLQTLLVGGAAAALAFAAGALIAAVI